MVNPHPKINDLFYKHEITITYKGNKSVLYVLTEHVVLEVLKRVVCEVEEKADAPILSWFQRCVDVLNCRNQDATGSNQYLVMLRELLVDVQTKFDLSFSWIGTVRAPSPDKEFYDYLEKKLSPIS